MTNPIRKRAWTPLEHFPSLVAGVTGLVVVAIYFLFRNELVATALFTEFGELFRIAWVVIVGVGGISCIYGVLGGRPRIEGGGLSLLGSAYLIDAIAIFSHGNGLFTGALIFAAGINLWFQSFVLYPKRDYPASNVISLQDYENKAGITPPHTNDEQMYDPEDQ